MTRRNGNISIWATSRHGPRKGALPYLARSPFCKLTEILLSVCYVHYFSSSVRIDGVLSSERRITAGVSQGSIIGSQGRWVQLPLFNDDMLSDDNTNLPWSPRYEYDVNWWQRMEERYPGPGCTSAEFGCREPTKCLPKPKTRLTNLCPSYSSTPPGGSTNFSRFGYDSQPTYSRSSSTLIPCGAVWPPRIKAIYADRSRQGAEDSR